MNRLILLMFLSGCTTGYKHMSSDSRGDDGYDLVCAGVEIRDVLSVEANACHNLASYGGNYFVGEITYHWSDR